MTFMEKDEEEWWTLEDAIKRGEQDKKALIQDALKEGVEQGIEIGKEQDKKETLQLLIETKFHIDASDWINTLDGEAIVKAMLLMLSCDSFDDLKKQISLDDKTK